MNITKPVIESHDNAETAADRKHSATPLVEQKDTLYEACKRTLLAGRVSYASGVGTWKYPNARVPSRESNKTETSGSSLRHCGEYQSGTRAYRERIVPRVCVSVCVCAKAVTTPVVRVGGPCKCRKSGYRNGCPQPGIESWPLNWKALKESHRASISCFARFCHSTYVSRPGSQSVALLGSHLGLDPSCCFASCCGKHRLFKG